MTDRLEKLEALADTLSRVYYYGDFRAESINERIIEGLLTELGFWPTTEDEIILRPEYADLVDKYK